MIMITQPFSEKGQLSCAFEGAEIALISNILINFKNLAMKE